MAIRSLIKYLISALAEVFRGYYHDLELGVLSICLGSPSHAANILGLL